MRHETMTALGCTHIIRAARMGTHRCIALALLVVSRSSRCLRAASDKPAQSPPLRSAPVMPTMTRADRRGVAPPPPTEDERRRTARRAIKQDNDWVPAEFKSGVARWKDTGVYLDGKPIGFLTWGELPIGLKPTWVQGQGLGEQAPGHQRSGLAVGAAAVLPVHRLPEGRSASTSARSRSSTSTARRFSQTRSSRPSKDLQLADRRRSSCSGSARTRPARRSRRCPRVSATAGPGDKITAVMIYIDKKPPKLVHDEGFELDGSRRRPACRTTASRSAAASGSTSTTSSRRSSSARSSIRRRRPRRPTASRSGSSPSSSPRRASTRRRSSRCGSIRDEKPHARSSPAAELAKMTFQASAQAKGGVLARREAHPRERDRAPHARAQARRSCRSRRRTTSDALERDRPSSAVSLAASSCRAGTGAAGGYLGPAARRLGAPPHAGAPTPSPGRSLPMGLAVASTRECAPGGVQIPGSTRFRADWDPR